MSEDNKVEQLQSQLKRVQEGNYIPYKDQENGIKDTVEQLKVAGVKITPEGETQKQTPASKPQTGHER